MNTFLHGRLEVLQGDITALKIDAIVNAANSGLLGGGGVDGAIHRAGGPAILAACRELRRTVYPDGLPPGEAVITTAGNLPSSYVIHTVGPVWHGGKSGEEDTLARAYKNCLDLAGEQKISGIAFPAISTGVYGFPKDRAARIAFTVVREYAAEREIPKRIQFVFFSAPDMDVFLRTVRSLEGAPLRSGIPRPPDGE